MKKIRLDAEELQVSSFDMSPAMAAEPGTVRANGTGYTCYHTVAYIRTMCLEYEPSYWGEDTCGPVLPMTDPAVCPPTQDYDCTFDSSYTCVGYAGC